MSGVAGGIATWLLLACTAEEEKAAPEPLVLPDDPAAAGAPVGVRTVEEAGQVMEIWYPASDSSSGPAEAGDFDPFIPDSVTALIGTVDLPDVPTLAIRDAPLRTPEAPYPVILFSHGFGGTRIQSTDVTVHLASRGYVVVAADHPGRTMRDIVPCLFDPPAEGCDLSGFGADPAVEDVQTVADLLPGWADSGFFAGAIDPEALGLSGHSAGAGTTTSVGAVDSRFKALLPMAGGAVGATPTLIMSGTCDSFIPDSGQEGATGEIVRIAGAGHLAFSDLCELDLSAFAEEYLSGRDDLNETVLDLLLQLATDGCPGFVPAEELACGDTFLPLTTSDPIIRHYATVFFDQQLYGRGDGVQYGVFAEVE